MRSCRSFFQYNSDVAFEIHFIPVLNNPHNHTPKIFVMDLYRHNSQLILRKKTFEIAKYFVASYFAKFTKLLLQKFASMKFFEVKLIA